jgi:hypothetical protein
LPPRAAGCPTLAEIADAMMARGIRALSGKQQWHASTSFPLSPSPSAQPSKPPAGASGMTAPMILGSPDNLFKRSR